MKKAKEMGLDEEEYFTKVFEQTEKDHAQEQSQGR